MNVSGQWFTNNMTSTAAISTEFGTHVPRPVLADREALLEQIEANERAMRRLSAERLQLFAELLDIAAIAADTEANDEWLPVGERGDLEYRALRAEVAASLRATEYQVGRDIDFAHTLTTEYWQVWQALDSGAISERHARVVVDAGMALGCDPSAKTQAARDAYVQGILPAAAQSTPAQLRPLAQRVAEQFAERSLDTRHAEARTRRRVVVAEAADGMADLYAHLPAVEAYTIKHRLMQMGKQVAQIDHSRSRDEIHADIFTDLLVTGTPEHHDALVRSGNATSLGAVRGQVQIICGCDALVCGVQSQASDLPDHTDHPHAQHSPRFPRPAQPELVGYGPIDRTSARTLAGHAHAWEVISIEATTGAVLTVDRYRPSEQMRRLLGARDTHCRFPGCRVPLARCDLDHTIDAARGGPTATDNLAHLCRSHHTLKHHSGWRVQQETGGVLRWISPAGRTHIDRPPSLVHFTSPPSPPIPPAPPPW